MIHSDTENENETHGAGKRFFASTEEWSEDNISQKTEDLTGVSGVTTESNSPQNASKITKINFCPAKIKIVSHRC